NDSSKSNRTAAHDEFCEQSAPTEDNGDRSEPSHLVGYRRPPKHTQFKKGQSGNLKGRPKGSRNLSSELRKVLTDPVIVQMDGKRRCVPAILALQRVLLSRALKGDQRASLAVFKNAKEFGVLDQIEESTDTNHLTDETLRRITYETLQDLIRVERELSTEK